LNPKFFPRNSSPRTVARKPRPQPAKEQQRKPANSASNVAREMSQKYSCSTFTLRRAGAAVNRRYELWNFSCTHLFFFALYVWTIAASFQSRFGADRARMPASSFYG
jgi:hypothetical protein